MRFYLTLSLTFSAAFALFFLTLTTVCAQDKPPQDKPTTESPSQQREEDLQDEELQSLKRAWKKHEEEKKEENPSGASSEEQKLLEAIAGKMKTAERRLSEEDPGDETQKKQLEAINLLNDLITKAQEEQPLSRPLPGNANKTDPSGRTPAQPNSERQKALLGKTEREQERNRRQKGSAIPYRLDLPARSREDVQMPDSDEFPEKYRKHLERYYNWMLKMLKDERR
jgi:hypothetical protein